MHGTIRRGLAMAATAALILAGAVGSHGISPQYPSPSTAQAAGSQATGPEVDWNQYDGTNASTRYSPLTQINASNISKLGVAWTAQQGNNLSEWETAPVVTNGVMYYTTNSNQVRAVNPSTGKLLWQYTPKVNFYKSIAGGGGGVAVNRGVIVVNGIVYLITFDVRVVALQASTGEKLWEANIQDPNAGYAESSPAVYWNGLLFVGSEEGDAGQRGFEAALDAKTGKRVWVFYSVPAAGKGWMPAVGHHGGGDSWMPATVDPQTGILYFGTGNPSPDFVNTQRPGCNPYADATVALNAKTGKMIWATTELCNDVWDYDTEQTPILFDTMIKGVKTRVIGQANKGGQYFFLNAKTGAKIAVSPHLGSWSTPHLKPTSNGVKVCPGTIGGIEYGPTSYSPDTNLAYVGYINECQIYSTLSLADINAHLQGQVDSGGSVALASKVTGGMAAIDPATGKIVWNHKLNVPMGGGSMTTASGLVFAGADDGYFYAFDAKTGKTVWRADVGLGFGAPPIAYEINGVEYVAIAAGGGASSATVGAPLGGSLVVFKLGGGPLKKQPSVVGGSAVPVGLPSTKGYIKVNSFMYADPAQHHAIIQVIAAQTGANAGFNFDGLYNGSGTFIVPLHWSVDIEFKNLAALPHSMAIAKTNKPGPPLETFGFGPVISSNFTVGTISTNWQLIGMLADHPGKFYLVCYVPGHIASGMWDNFVVSSTATMPSLSGTGI